MNKETFQEIVMRRGRELYRDMPWRTNTDPYYVLVSELMLQQTQVDRVISKFNTFVSRFSDIQQLAKAPLADVLTAWNGLGYNRRAKFLHDAAKRTVNDFAGVIPGTLEELTSLPGVGPNTAGAILAYSFNQPIIFIETNIRTVYFYHFFEDQDKVSDRELLKLMAETFPKDLSRSRQWYQALMDYGSYLKKQGVGRITKSIHYTKQTPLKGSLREVRGLIVRCLTLGDMNESDLRAATVADDRFDAALTGLIHDGLVSRTGLVFHLTK
ncbi:A/G-specific adenine glycosylase [Patescibacteria group bacterium]|nr:MAG: A/G-specific adenine glycosylase [Patescibacteria group bacterium]